MPDWPNNLHDSAHDSTDGSAIGVAMVGRDESGEFVVTACNDPFFELTGATRAHGQTFPIPLDALLPDDARLAFREKVHTCLRSGSAQELEQNDKLRAGAQRWRLSLEPINRTNGGAAAAEVLVMGFSIAAQPQRMHELEVSAARYRAVVDSAYDAIVTIDQQHNITLFNRAAENLFGYTAAEVLGRSIETLLPEQFRANHSSNVQRFANSPDIGMRRMTAPRMDESNSVYGQHRDGSVIPVEIAISRIEVEGVFEFTAVVRDITDRARAMELLKKQAVTDALTGLPNRREFVEFVDRMLRTEDTLSVFILDIDFFKNINDSHGHDAGDEVLRLLAKVGMSMTHGSGLFARWGGEEFVGALPGADAALAQGMAEKLRQRIEQQDFEHEWRLQALPFTVSIGVVTREAGESDVDTLMRRADRALYRAKKSGRNCVEVG